MIAHFINGVLFWSFNDHMNFDNLMSFTGYFLLNDVVKPPVV